MFFDNINKAFTFYVGDYVLNNTIAGLWGQLRDSALKMLLFLLNLALQQVKPFQAISRINL